MSERRIPPVSKKIILALLVVALLGVILAVCPGCGVTNPVAQTKLGKVQGQAGSGGILVFKGIPTQSHLWVSFAGSRLSPPSPGAIP